MIQRIGIIGGTGMMGRTLAPAFARLGATVQVTGSRDPHLEQALVKESDWVILSVPIDKMPEVVHRIQGWLKPGQLLSDFCSIKQKVIPEMMKTEAEVISIHPMFGAVPSLKGHNVILLPTRPGKWLHKVERIFKQLELNTLVLEDWKEHDSLMSMIQGLLHFIHITFSHTLVKSGMDLDKLLQVCSPVYEANFAFACRILQRDPALYTHILMDNQENVKVISSFIEQAKQSLKLIEHNDAPAFIQAFERSRDHLGQAGVEWAKESDFLIEKLKEFRG